MTLQRRVRNKADKAIHSTRGVRVIKRVGQSARVSLSVRQPDRACMRPACVRLSACVPSEKRDGDRHIATATCRGQDTPPPRHERTQQRAGGAGRHDGGSGGWRVPPRRTCRGTPHECCGTASYPSSAREERARGSAERAGAGARGREVLLA